MKRLTMVLVMFVILMGCLNGALAEDLGVVVINPDEAAEPAAAGALDNLKLNASVDVEGFGTISPTSFDYIDYFFLYGGRSCRSGAEADFAFFRMDVLNTTLQTTDYLEKNSVEVVFDDKIRYEGWCYQYNYDKEENEPVKDSFPIAPYYVGHYVFGCALPNAIISSKAPLRMIIKLGDVEMTYIIR